MVTDMSGLQEQLLNEGARLRDVAAAAVLVAVKEAAPVGKDSPTRTTAPGGLRDSLEISDTADTPPVFIATISSDKEYASFTDEQDTNPHLIFPTAAAKSLRFWWENGPIGPGIYNFKQVLHPGTKGQHWFESKNEDRWITALTEAAN